MQDFLATLWRKVTFDNSFKLNAEYLDSIEEHLNSPDKVELLTKKFFSRKLGFHYDCINLVQQILHNPNATTLLFELELKKPTELVHLIRIADSFGRFDLGYYLKVLWIRDIEEKIINQKAKRGDYVTYLLTKERFGQDLFHFEELHCEFKVPFYLKWIHRRFFVDFYSSHEADKSYIERIKQKNIALLVPGILNFNNDLINELKSFDEIIPLNYQFKNYGNVQLPFRISYYAYEIGLRLLNEDTYKNDDNLDYYCLLFLDSGINGHREIIFDKRPWFIGNPNLVQYTLFDLLVFSPKSIKIYGMNLYLSANPYYLKYSSSKVTPKALMIHDLVYNFLFIKNLHHKSMILLDDEANMIVTAGVLNYVKKMTELYRIY
jgi:hypothetical protein